MRQPEQHVPNGIVAFCVGGAITATLFTVLRYGGLGAVSLMSLGLVSVLLVLFVFKGAGEFKAILQDALTFTVVLFSAIVLDQIVFVEWGGAYWTKLIIFVLIGGGVGTLMHYLLRFDYKGLISKLRGYRNGSQ